MKMLSFANRNAKEILRDPINLAFGLGFPLVLILLLSVIQANIPVNLFEIQHLTPGITVFGLSFMSLFSATIIARDRSSALLQRLYGFYSRLYFAHYSHFRGAKRGLLYSRNMPWAGYYRKYTVCFAVHNSRFRPLYRYRASLRKRV